MVNIRELARPVGQASLSQLSRQSASQCLRRCASTEAAEAAKAPVPDLLELEQESSLGAPPPTEEQKKAFESHDGSARKYQLPSARYQYHPPVFQRGPLHPTQSPVSSDPVARDFIPGPFNMPRLKQTYQSTVAADLMTLAYDHKPPGTERKVIGQRLREWDGSSPYHKGRPLRSPRGNPVLNLVERGIDFRNIPEVRAVTLSTYVPAALKNEDFLLVARAAVQAVTGTVPETIKTRKSVAQWNIAEGKKAGVKTTIYGNAAYEFLDKCVHLVFPRIKDWPGLKGSTGDSSGNLSFGLTHENMALFPEIEVNYDIYPPKMLPGCRVFVETTANSDRQARLLFQALGFPFYGRLRN